MTVSGTQSGFTYDRQNNRLGIYHRGALVGYVTATGTTFSAGVTLGSTLTAGADGVGADGEQLTSGGAGAECDWAAAGSLRAFKHLLGERTDAPDVLALLRRTPVHDFTYRRRDETGVRITSTGDTETVYTGVVADEAPWAMHHGGRILNPVNALGYCLLAIKALADKVDALESRPFATTEGVP
jgi:hypothetical protein